MARLLSVFNNSNHNASICCANQTEKGSAFKDEGAFIDTVIDDSGDKWNGLQLKCKFQYVFRNIYIWDDNWNFKFTEITCGAEYIFKISHSQGVIRLVIEDNGIILLNNDDGANSIYPREEHYRFYKMFFDEDKWVVKPSDK
ncbi:hypothetical protein C1H46_029860 [Malus baccata]|uniref:S-protein homolog n=1 Tax=Malus baccata TaxID=106549 RepID=A0A540LDR3_MALBA|nr:hypothetical protein C1H46_029860 [Malus baccata]